MLNNSVYGNYRTRKFTDIWGTAADFLTDYKTSAIPQLLSDEDATTLYYLLYARYGNSSIANADETQFKYKMFSTIYQYGATWARKNSIQKKLRELTEDEILAGTRAVNNHAYNPQTAPATDNEELLNYINEQAVTKYKKSVMDGYALLWGVLRDNYTDDFLRKFRYHFLIVVEPQLPLWYVTEIAEQSGTTSGEDGPNFAI